MTNRMNIAGAAAFIASAMTISALPAGAQVAHAAEETILTEGEAKLARLLDGRVAGTPQNCIPSNRIRDFESIDRTALVYAIGDTIYVNYTRIPETIDDDDLVLSRQFGTRLCRLDNVTTHNRSNNLYSGNLFLTEFIPYRRAD